MIFQLSFRGPRGAVVPGRLSRMDGGTVVSNSQALLGYDQVVFLIHGFNVDQSDGRTSLKRFAEALPQNNTALVVVLWPGDSPVGPLSYSFTEGHQADDTAFELSRFIESQVGDETPVNFVAHSLGCRLTLETLARLLQLADADPDRFPVNQVCLLAAATDDYCLALPRKYKRAAERAARVVVLSSVKDSVLRYVYPVGDLFQSFFFWKETAGLALGYRGPIARGSERMHKRNSLYRRIEDLADNIVAISIPPNHEVGHAHYLPPGKQQERIDERQQASIDLVSAALALESDLEYRLPP